MKHINEAHEKEQVRAWRFYGILSEAFERTTKLLQPQHFAAVVTWTDGEGTAWISGYVEGKRMLPRNRVYRIACLRSGNSSFAWPAEGSSRERSRHLLSLHSDVQNITNGTGTGTNQTLAWWTSAGAGPPPAERLQHDEAPERLVDTVQRNAASLCDDDLLTFAANNAVGELVRDLTSSGTAVWRLVSGRVMHTDQFGRVTRSSKQEICNWLCKQLYDACVPVMQRLSDRQTLGVFLEASTNAEHRCNILSMHWQG